MPLQGGVAKVSHTLSVPLARRLEEFAFYQRLSESAVIECALLHLFGLAADDERLADMLRLMGACRRRKNVIPSP